MLLECILLLGLAALLLYKYARKPHYLPPGSFGLPVLGTLPPSNFPITEHLRTLRDKYGNIFTTKWGSRVVVVLADVNVIKKAFNEAHFQDRVGVYSFMVFNYFKDIGSLSTSGKIWSDNRRFALRQLKDLGMGKTHLEVSIHEEAKMLVEHLEVNCLNKPADIDWSITMAVLNVIWQLLASKRHSADDKDLREYYVRLAENIDIMQGPMFLLDVMPWIEKVMPHWFIDRFAKVELMKKNRDILFEMYRKVVDHHKENLDPDNPRDLIDHYLLEMADNKNDSDSVFCEDPHNPMNLMGIMKELFNAGTDTTSATLRWMILYLANRPQIQKKAHQVLDEVVPKDRLPSLHDRPQLAYIDALIFDVLRLSSLVPTGIPHCASATVRFEGYIIPKGTMLLPCLEMCHHDPNLWDYPHRLYPEHFLDSDGKLDSKKSGFVPFSTGRRQCMGESLARMELFLFGAAILHSFTISPPPGVTLREDPDPNQKLLQYPRPYKVILSKRTQ